jgi:hypothetical protein
MQRSIRDDGAFSMRREALNKFLMRSSFARNVGLERLMLGARTSSSAVTAKREFDSTIFP